MNIKTGRPFYVKKENQEGNPSQVEQVIVEIEPDLSVVYCDRTRMTQVMQNLIDNAIKFMGEQAEPRIWIGHRTEVNQTVLFVRDNGMGIPIEHQSRICSLFDKLDPNAEGQAWVPH